MLRSVKWIALAVTAGMISGCLDTGASDDGGGQDLEPGVSAFNDLDLDARFTEREAGYRPTETDTVMLGGAHDALAMLPESGRADFYDQDHVALGNAEDDLSGVQAYRKKGLMADIDDDGKDETLIAVAKDGVIKLVIQDDEYHGFERMEVIELYDESALYAWDNDAKEFSISAGDVDGDNKLEIVAAMAAESTRNVTRLKVYEGADENFSLAFTDYYDTASPDQVTVRTAQLDADRAKEIVLLASGDQAKVTSSFDSSTNGYSLHLFDDGDTGGYQTLGSVSALSSGRLQGAMDTGDLTGNGRDDILVATTATERYLTAYGFSDGALEVLQEGSIDDPELHDDQDDTRVELVNLYGSAAPEIVVNESVYDNLERPAAGWVHLADIPMMTRGNGANKSFLNRHDFGDVDADGLFEVLAFKYGCPTSSQTKAIAVYEFAGAGNIDEVECRKLKGAIHLVNAFGDHPLLLSGRVEADGVVASYEEQHDQVIWSDPKVVAVLAAPPADTDYGMDLADSTSSVSFSTSESQENSVSFGVSASVGVGISVEDRVFTQSELEAGVRTSRSLNTEFSAGTELTRTTGYSTQASNDRVIATLVPYRAYVYRTAAGEPVEFYEPGTPVVRSVTLDYFIDNAGFDPTADYFTHTPGRVDSYLSSPYAESTSGVLSMYKTEDAREVPQQGGSLTRSIAISEFQSYSVSQELGVEAYMNVTAGGASVETSVGATIGEGISTSFGETTEYGMELGGIPVADHDEYRYQVGMFAHETEGRFDWVNPATGETEESHQNYHLVNFWVQR